MDMDMAMDTDVDMELANRWRWNLKGLSHERWWIKSAENLGATPYDRDLSIDITFSNTNLAGQSL